MLFSDTVFAGVGDSFEGLLVKSSVSYIPEGYVLATDDDFEWRTDGHESLIYEAENEGEPGHYWYVGDDEYVVIPNEIKGHKMTSYYRLFRYADDSLKGVMSTNSDVTVMHRMFGNIKSKSLELKYFDVSNVTDLGYFLSSSGLETIDLSHLNIQNHSDIGVGRIFVNSQLKNVYVKNQKDLDLFNTSSFKPDNLVFEIK